MRTRCGRRDESKDRGEMDVVQMKCIVLSVTKAEKNETLSR